MKNRYTTGHKGFLTLLEDDWNELLLDDLKIEHEKEITVKIVFIKEYIKMIFDVPLIGILVINLIVKIIEKQIDQLRISVIKMSDIKVDIIQSAIPASDNKYKYLFDWQNNINYVINWRIK